MTNNDQPNEYGSEVPKWIDKNFLIEVLQSFEKNEGVKIKNAEFQPAAAKGDHFASIMFRVIVDYYVNGGELKQISLILKTLPEVDERKREILEASRIFETEIGMYANEIPKIEAILRAAGDTTKLGPTVIYHGLSPNKFIILEDLVPLGYAPLRGWAPLEIVKAAYKKLARLHAVSFKLIKEQPESFSIYRHGLLNTFQNEVLFKNGILRFIEMLGRHADLTEYKPYFEALYQDNLQGRAVAEVEQFWKAPEKDTLYVLCHGDFHDLNFMLKCNKDNGKLDDLLLLDYQFSYVGHIGNDILYSIFTMLNSDQRMNNLDELLHFYFTQFTETLNRIGYKGKVPKLLNFLHQTERQRSLCLYLFITFLPMWLAVKKGEMDPREIEKSEECHGKLFNDPEHLECARKLLPKFLHRGYLEIH